MINAQLHLLEEDIKKNRRLKVTRKEMMKREGSGVKRVHLE